MSAQPAGCREIDLSETAVRHWVPPSEGKKPGYRRVVRSRQACGIPRMATVARTRSDQRFPVDLERFWNVRTGRASCSSVAPLLRKGGGLVDTPGRGLVGAKVEYPFHPIYLPVA